MKQRIFLIIFFTGCFLLKPSLSTGSSIMAVVDRTNASLEDTIQLTVTLKDGKGDVDTSNIKDFKVISQGTVNSTKITNNQMTYEQIYNYILIPNKKGKLIIPPLLVVIDGKSETTGEIIINVSDNNREDSRQEQEEDIKDISVKAVVSDQSPYEGQQIVYTFKLYQAVNMANANLQKPKFEGFSAKELEEKKPYVTNISGHDFTVTEINYLLTPIKSGEINIDSAILRCDIVSRQRRSRNNTFPFDSFFDDPFFGNSRLEPKILRTKPLTVNVKPLPPYNGNGKFSGLVGQFKIYSDLSQNKLKAFDSATLSITISGEGNIMDASSPKFQLSEVFKTYPDNPKEEIYYDTKGAHGKKVFRFALVANKPGKYDIEPFLLVYFNISNDKYETVSTDSISLTVTPSDKKDQLNVMSSTAAPNQSQNLKKKVEFISRDILPLKEDIDALNGKNLISFTKFITFLIIPVFVYSIFVGLFLIITKKQGTASNMSKRALKALKEAQNPNAKINEFLSFLYKALVFSIFSLNNTKGESLTSREAETILQSKRYGDDVIKEGLLLLNEIESSKYGGFVSDSSKRNELFLRTQKFIRNLTK